MFNLADALGRSSLTSCIIVGRWNAINTTGFASIMKQRFDTGGIWKSVPLLGRSLLDGLRMPSFCLRLLPAVLAA
jgi:hypothetical protein